MTKSEIFILVASMFIGAALFAAGGAFVKFLQ